MYSDTTTMVEPDITVKMNVIFKEIDVVEECEYIRG